MPRPPLVLPSATTLAPRGSGCQDGAGASGSGLPDRCRHGNTVGTAEQLRSGASVCCRERIPRDRDGERQQGWKRLPDVVP